MNDSAMREIIQPFVVSFLRWLFFCVVLYIIILPVLFGLLNFNKIYSPSRRRACERLVFVS